MFFIYISDLHKGNKNYKIVFNFSKLNHKLISGQIQTFELTLVKTVVKKVKWFPEVLREVLWRIWIGCACSLKVPATTNLEMISKSSMVRLLFCKLLLFIDIHSSILGSISEKILWNLLICFKCLSQIYCNIDIDIILFRSTWLRLICKRC